MSAATDLKVRLARGGSADGLLLAYDAPWLIEVAALTGCEYVVVDLEHEAIADDRVVELTRAAEVHGIPLLVRMPLSPRLTPFLSAGIAGVGVPHLRGRAHAEVIVAETRFRPLGRRSYYAQTRGARFGFGIDEANWTQQANEELIVIAMLEDEAVVSELAGVLRGRRNRRLPRRHARPRRVNGTAAEGASRRSRRPRGLAMPRRRKAHRCRHTDPVEPRHDRKST